MVAMNELAESEVREICDRFAGEVEVISAGSIEGLPETMPYESANARNIILYGPPGTGKTYRTASLALEILGTQVDINDREAVLEAFRMATEAGAVAFVTFHQSYSYEDFVEGIRPTLDDGHGTNDLSYKIVPGIFRMICARARMHPGDAFVLIIDEINRGNVSGIFGELISLIEDDKRLGRPESLTAVLPYSREAFGVPDNVFLVGTMNTADRSLTGLDAALRRRFEFRQIPPAVDLFKDSDTGSFWEVEEISVRDILSGLNGRLDALRGSDYLVGHAFFMPLAHPELRNISTLAEIFGRKVVPLLREYFFDDPESIMRALGQLDTTNQPWNLVRQAASPIPGLDKVWNFSDQPLTNVDFYRQVAGLPLSVDVHPNNHPAPGA
ncbi:hypothetical protein GCM10027599_00840 [Yimella radicis]